MAATRLDRVGDSTTTVYDVAFTLGFMRKEFVFVYLKNNEYVQQLGYAWINSTQIELNTPVPVGVEFHIRRVVPRDVPVNDYEAGAILREDNLDDSFLQHLMILEEIKDGYFVAEGDFKLQTNIDMGGNRVINVGGAVNAGDVVPLGQADERYVNVAGDTMTGPLSGIPATADAHFPTLLQLANIVDSRIDAITMTNPEFIDYGLVTEAVTNNLDYGSL